MEKTQPEPWLRGTHRDIQVVPRAAIHAIELAEERIICWCGQLSETEISATPCGLPSITVQLRHITQSLDRLLTYTEGRQLNDQQLAELRKEESGAAGSRAELFDGLAAALTESCRRIRQISETKVSLEEPRFVGRRALPTSVGGLLVHVADHTQRHTGQAITTAKMLLAQRGR